MSKEDMQVVSLYGGETIINFHPGSHRYYLVQDNGIKLPKQKSLAGATAYTGYIDKSDVLIPWAVKEVLKKATELLGNDPTHVFNRQEVLSIMEAAKQAPDEAKTRAGGIGDCVHTFAEEYSKDLDRDRAYKAMIEKCAPSDEDKKKIDTGIVALQKWIKDQKATILESEQIVYSRRHGYVGKFDAIMEIAGKRYLVDYKTSNGVYSEHYLQASAYLKAYEEEAGAKVFDGAIIIGIVKEDKLDKEGNVVKTAGTIIPVFRTRADLVLDYKAFKGLIPVRRRMTQLDAEYFKSLKKK